MGLWALGRGALAPVAEPPHGRAHERALKTMDARLSKLSRQMARKREQLARQKERAAQIAERARTRTRATEHREKVAVIERKEEKLDVIARKIEGGQLSPAEIRELMASGALSLRRG